MDKEVNSALIRLLDALCEWERNSGRRSHLFLIPEQPDERVVVAQDGKPVPENFNPVNLFEFAMRSRNEAK